MNPATQPEAPLDPSQLIVDAHHHLYDRPDCRYLMDDMVADVAGGHDVRATVYVQARSMMRAQGPVPMRPVGETEFANGIGAMCASGLYGPAQICAAIVGFADLLLGDEIRPVLEAHLAAAGSSGRFRGVRHISAWDPDPAMLNPAYPSTEDMLDSTAFRAGLAHLAPLGLSFDAWLYFHQIPSLISLARAFPKTPIVLDHCGGILGVGRYTGRHDTVFAAWAKALRELASCPNVMVKLGGLGMPLCGFGFDRGVHAPSSTELAEAWRPWMAECIDRFGTRRCMFESNFPVDKISHPYTVGWNAMQRIADGASADEKSDLFWRSAARFYRLPAELLEPARLSTNGSGA